MPNRTIIRTQGGVQKNLTVNRDREAGVKILTSGYVYPSSQFHAHGVSSNFQASPTDVNDKTEWVIVSNLGSSNFGAVILASGFTASKARVGKHRVEFDVTLNSGVINDGTGSGAQPFLLVTRDHDADPAGSQISTTYPIFVGHNSLDVEIFDDGDSTYYPSVFLSARPNSVFDVTVSNIKVTHNFKQLTANRTAPVITSDRKGEPRPLLSKLVGGASAAYSLRDLNDRKGNNKVVRVRRASDNHERDFLAKEVSNGTLENWVNTQAVLPLDIKTLTDDGRTGAVIPAAAAYSLRNLSSTYGGSVVHVRRNIDHQNSDFTAAQVADGTLESFVNHDFSSSLPLDVDDTDAYRAYSLRNIVGGYSGNVVEVRRSGDSRLNSFKANEITMVK